MNYQENEIEFLEKLAKSTTGQQLVRILKHIEQHYADIRNLKEVSAEVRVDALKLLREALLDKLLVLSGQQESADNNEWN